SDLNVDPSPITAEFNPYANSDWMGSQMGSLKTLPSSKLGPEIVEYELHPENLDLLNLDSFDSQQSILDQDLSTQTSILRQQLSTASTSNEELLFAPIPSGMGSLDSYDGGFLLKNELDDCDSGLSMPATPHDDMLSFNQVSRLSSVISADSLDSITSDIFPGEEVLSSHKSQQLNDRYSMAFCDTPDITDSISFNYNDFGRASTSSFGSDMTFSSGASVGNESPKEDVKLYTPHATQTLLASQVPSTVQQFQQQQQKQQYLQQGPPVGTRHAHMYRAVEEYASTGSMASIQSATNDLNSSKSQKTSDTTPQVANATSTGNPTPQIRARSSDSVSSCGSTGVVKKTKRPSKATTANKAQAQLAKNASKIEQPHQTKIPSKLGESAVKRAVSGSVLNSTSTNPTGNSKAGSTQGQKADSTTPVACANCETTTTTMWRNNSAGQVVCNACGLYERVNNCTRPKYLKSQTIRRRKPRRCKQLEQGVRPCVVQIRPNLNTLGPLAPIQQSHIYNPKMQHQQQIITAQHPQRDLGNNQIQQGHAQAQTQGMTGQSARPLAKVSASATEKPPVTLKRKIDQSSGLKRSASRMSYSPSTGQHMGYQNSNSNPAKKLRMAESVPTPSNIRSATLPKPMNVAGSSDITLSSKGAVAFNSSMQRVIMNRCKNIRRPVDYEAGSTSSILASVVKAELV
ncbi:hypothetical protein SARC_12959, partial [Sphaeroforma arctica JP610]